MCLVHSIPSKCDLNTKSLKYLLTLLNCFQNAFVTVMFQTAVKNACIASLGFTCEIKLMPVSNIQQQINIR